MYIVSLYCQYTNNQLGNAIYILIEVTAFTPCTKTVGGKSAVSSVSKSRYCALVCAQLAESMRGGAAR